MTKNLLPLAACLVLAACASPYVANNDAAKPVHRSIAAESDLDVQARSVQGKSPLEKVSVIKNCDYIVIHLDDNTLRVGLNSRDARSANILIDVPKANLPLADGSSFTDAHGSQVQYSQGVLSSIRKRSDDTFGGSEVTTMSLRVSPDLQNISSGKMESVYKKLLGSELQAIMTCQF